MARLHSPPFSRLRAPAWSAAIAGVLWLIIGHGFANYDALYGLVWGQELAHGKLPDYSVSIAPTPHPLSTLVGIVLEPLGAGGSEDAIVVLAYLALGALGYLIYRLGCEWFGWQVGLLAAVLVLTREPILSYGVRAYVDLPYIVLVLAGLLIEVRRPKAGIPVLVLLAVAGLLRPEAWLFSLAYLVWVGRGRTPRELVALLAVAALGPLLWMLSDLAVTGNPLWSLTNTRHTALTLKRKTGLINLPLYGPRRFGEIVRYQAGFAGVAGLVMVMLWTRRRGVLAAAAGAVALAAFSILSIAGLPIITRYVLLPAALLCVFAGAGLLGWLNLERGHPRRGLWMLVSALVAVVGLVFIPSQEHIITRTFDAFGRQQRIEADLEALVSSKAIATRCGPVAAPNHRPVPLLALRLDTPPETIIDAQVQRPTHGTYADPASYRIQRDYTLDPNDPKHFVATVPPGFHQVSQNRSWKVFERCG